MQSLVPLGRDPQVSPPEACEFHKLQMPFRDGDGSELNHVFFGLPLLMVKDSDFPPVFTSKGI